MEKRVRIEKLLMPYGSSGRGSVMAKVGLGDPVPIPVDKSVLRRSGRR